MRRRSKMILLPICALAVAATASVAIAGTGGDSREGRSKEGPLLRMEVPPGDDHLAELADKLGVSTGKLRDAIDAARPDRPPRPPASPEQFREHMQEICKEMTDAIASELGKTGDELRDAIKAVIKDDIEAAVDAGDLTRARADRILERIDDAECLPPFGAHKLAFGGGPCGGPGKMMFRHDRPDRSRGNGDADFVEPAPGRVEFRLGAELGLRGLEAAG
jgi:hypothetical protein